MKLAYIDSCVWISWIEGLSEYQAVINEAMRQLSLNGWTFCVSDAVVLEVLINPLKQQYDPLVEAYRKIFEKARDLKVYTDL